MGESYENISKDLWGHLESELPNEACRGGWGRNIEEYWATSRASDLLVSQPKTCWNKDTCRDMFATVFYSQISTTFSSVEFLVQIF